MAAQTARLVGLIILLLEMRHMGASRMESLVFIAWLVIGFGTIISNFFTITSRYPPSFRFRQQCSQHWCDKVQSLLSINLCYRMLIVPPKTV
jgi:hypothetical protein